MVIIHEHNLMRHVASGVQAPIQRVAIASDTARPASTALRQKVLMRTVPIPQCVGHLDHVNWESD